MKSTAILAAAAGSMDIMKAAQTAMGMEAVDDPEASAISDELPPLETGGKLIISAPMLQNYAETSMGVAFAVSDMANGYVIVGEKEDLSDGRKVLCGGYRVTDISDKVILVRLTGLKPATRYYYRIGADRISYLGGYKMKILGNEEDSRIYSFVTAGKKARAHFCVINDTHVQMVPFGLAIEKIAELNPSCVIWNGDASNVEETIEAQMRIFLTPDIKRTDYASEIPYLLAPGNHDNRGMANRHLEKVWMFRQGEERSSRDWDLGRNFAVRMGEIAMIGLDTAEDKVDTNPRFAGLFTSKAYREAQTVWLKDVLKRKEISSAPYLVAFCHIPLFDPVPNHNPGDIYPDDSDPRYTTDYAYWQRTCAKMWCPLLEKAGCQVIITGHQHHYKYFAPEPGRPWAEIVGGGPEMGVNSKRDPTPNPVKFPTVVEGEVTDGRLTIRIHNLLKGEVIDTFTYRRR